MKTPLNRPTPVVTGRLRAARRAHYMRKLMRPIPARRPTEWEKLRVMVIESDDWGLCGEGKDGSSVERLGAMGYDLSAPRLRGSTFNTLESPSDMSKLFELLLSHKDSLGRHPVFTANYVVTNPHFEKVEASSFSEYAFVPISEGFPDEWQRGDLRGTWRLGIRARVWRPEFHGYSHFNFKNWLRGLKAGDRKLRAFFAEAMVGDSEQHPTASEYFANPKDGSFAGLEEQRSLVLEGCRIFKSTFGYWPTSTIPPHDLYDLNTARAFLSANLRFIQSERTRASSLFGEPVSSPARGVLFALLSSGFLSRLPRNVRFELEDDVSSALETLEYILKLGDPVVVGTHRVNYVSGVDPRSAEEGRAKLGTFLKAVTGNKDLIFMTAPELYQIYLRGYSVIRLGEELVLRNLTPSEIKVAVEGIAELRGVDLTHDREFDSTKRLRSGGAVYLPPLSTISFTP